MANVFVWMAKKELSKGCQTSFPKEVNIVPCSHIVSRNIPTGVNKEETFFTKAPKYVVPNVPSDPNDRAQCLPNRRKAHKVSVEHQWNKVTK